MNIRPLLKKEWLEMVRSKRLLILIILFGFAAVASPVMAKLMPQILKLVPATPGLVINIPDPTWKDAVDQLVKNVSQIGLMVIMIIFAGSVVEEKSRKTLELVLTKPISRASFIVAKHLVIYGTFTVLYAGMSAVFYLYTVSILGAFSVPNFLWVSLFIWVYLLFSIGLTLLFSTVARSQIVALVLAFTVQIGICTIFGLLEGISKYSPAYIIGGYQKLMVNGQYHDFIWSLPVSAAFIILSLLLSVWLFKRQEVER